MAYGFVSKNSTGEYLITDQTTNLTFVKRVITPYYTAVSQTRNSNIGTSGFGGSTEFTYRVYDCPTTPIAFFTCPVAEKAYAITKTLSTGNNTWDITLITSATATDTPSSGLATIQTVPTTGFTNTLDAELKQTEDEWDGGYKNDQIRPYTNGAITYAGRHYVVPQDYDNLSSEAPTGLARGGYILAEDQSDYKISTNHHVPFSMGYYPPGRRIRFHNILKSGEELFHKQNSNLKPEGNHMGLFQYIGGDLAHYQVNVAHGGTDGGAGSMRGAAHYRWVFPTRFANRLDAWNDKANNPFQTTASTVLTSGTYNGKLLIYVSPWSYDKIRIGQHLNYCTNITTADLDAGLGGISTSGWKEVLHKFTQIFYSGQQSEYTAYCIVVDHNVTLEDDPGYKLRNVDKKHILPGGKYWPYFHLHARGFVNNSGTAASATFSSTDPNNSNITDWYNARLTSNFTDSNIDFFPMRLKYDYTTRFYNPSAYDVNDTYFNSSKQDIGNFSSLVSYLESTHSSANTLAEVVTPADIGQTRDFKPFWSRESFNYTGLANGFGYVGSWYFRHTKVQIEIPVLPFSVNTIWAPNTIDTNVLYKGYDSSHKLYFEWPAYRQNGLWSPGHGPGSIVNNVAVEDRAETQLISRTANTLTFNQTVALPRTVRAAMEFYNRVRTSTSSVANTGNTITVFRGSTQLLYSNATSGTPAAGYYRLGTPYIDGNTPEAVAGTVSASPYGTAYATIGNLASMSSTASSVLLKIPIIYRRTEDTWAGGGNTAPLTFSDVDTTYFTYRIHNPTANGITIEHGVSNLINTQAWQSGTGSTSAPVAIRTNNTPSTITFSLTSITGAGGGLKYYQFEKKQTGVDSTFVNIGTRSAATSKTISLPLTGDYYTIYARIKYYDSTTAADADYLAVRTASVSVFADGTTKVSLVKFDGVSTFELATDSEAWVHDGIATTPNDLQSLYRAIVPGVATVEGTIDNFIGTNVEPFYVKPFCGFSTGDGDPRQYNEVPHLPWETRYFNYYPRFNTSCHEHYSTIGYQAYTTNYQYGKFNIGENGSSSDLGPMIASNYTGSSTSTITRGSNDNLQLGISFVDDDPSSTSYATTVKSFTTGLSSISGQARGYVRAHYGSLNSSGSKYSEAIVWDGQIVATNSYNTNTGVYSTLANPITVGSHTYTRDTSNGLVGDDFLTHGVKRYGPTDLGDIPGLQAGTWNVSNLPELFIFSKPSSAPAGHGDHGVQIFHALDNGVVFDTRKRPLVLADTTSVVAPSTASPLSNSSSLKANSWGGRFQNHSSVFNPTNTLTTSINNPSLPAYFYNSKAQCHQELKKTETETEREAFGAIKRTYYHTTLYWALYKAGVARSASNSSQVRLKYITVNKGAAYQYRKSSNYIFMGTGATTVGYSGIRPWNNETINNGTDTLLTINTASYRGATYDVGGTLDSITGKVQLTGEDRLGTFSNIDNKTLRIRTGDLLRLSFNISGREFHIVKIVSAQTQNLKPDSIFPGVGGVDPGLTHYWVPHEAGTYRYRDASDYSEDDMWGTIYVESSS